MFPAHAEFTVVTQPLAGHTLCGPLDYKPFYGPSAEPLDGDEPVTYNESTREFTAFSNDDNLIGTVEDYGVTACFENWPPTTYPTVSTTSNNGEIMFNEPCLDPFTFAATAQTSPPANYFDGEDIVFNLNPFTLTPDRCRVVYTCHAVEPSTAGSPTCADFNFDFTFDGVPDNGLVDGKLVFVATPQDYADGTYVPGTYTVTVRGQPARATDQRTDDATFDIVLLDPCDPPTSLTAPGYGNISYTLTDAAIPQNWIEFSASRG